MSNNTPAARNAHPQAGPEAASGTGTGPVPVKEPDAPLRARTRGFNFWYGTFHALQDIDLPIVDHKVTALIGASGCGKSTFLRSFNRMHDLYPDNRYRGEIRLYPEDVNIVGPEADPMVVRLRVGMVFQKANPFPKSVFENVAAGLRVRGVRNRTEINDRVEWALKQAALWDEISDRLGDSAYSLSGGQQQRLCIARALAPKPELLLLDEPTSALDPIATAKIEDLITDLSDNTTVLIVTHNMQQAARISDYTAFMHLGEVVEYNDTNTLFTTPDSPRTEAYITGKFG